MGTLSAAGHQIELLNAVEIVIEGLVLCFLVLLAAINIAFAVGVYRIAKPREQLGGPGNLFVNAIVWTLTTLFGGVFVATAYWLSHLSSLSNPAPDQSEQIR